MTKPAKNHPWRSGFEGSDGAWPTSHPEGIPTGDISDETLLRGVAQRRREAMRPLEEANFDPSSSFVDDIPLTDAPITTGKAKDYSTPSAEYVEGPGDSRQIPIAERINIAFRQQQQ